MARYKGKDGEMSAGGNAVGEIESFDLTISSAELSANVMGSDWTDAEGGQKTATASVSVLRDPADTGQSPLDAGATVACIFYTEGNSSGLTSWTGDFLVTEVGISTSVGDLVKTSYSLRNKGTVTEASIA